MSGHVPSAVAGLTPVGRLEPGRPLQIAIALPLRDKEGLTNLLRQVYTRNSPSYRHYLSPAQFAEKFGPAPADYKSVMAFAAAHRLTVTATHSNRTLLDVIGSVSDIEKALHITLRTYSDPREKRTFFAAAAEPSLDLATPVLHISGLDNYIRPRSLSVRKKAQAAPATATFATGSGPSGTYLGNDFRAAYAPGVALNGAGQSVGILEFDGYYSNDVSNYENLAGLPAVPVTNVYLDGFNGNPGINNLEVALDIELVISMAPGLSSIIVYEGEFTDDILNRMATDDQANQLSASWTYPIDPATEQIFQQFAAQGQSFFNSSGDSDAWVAEIPTPCDDPNITIVGGTTLTTSGPGGSWVSETVWNWGNELGSNYNGEGSGGGVSLTYSIPAWQLGVNMAANQGSTAFRNVPDVALTADNVLAIADNGQQESVGGTSCSSQLWAAFAALANEQAAARNSPPIGFLNPALYALGLSSNYTNGFNDITNGNNTWSESPVYFDAVPGYDLCSGWGTPTASLISLLAADSLQISPSSNWTSSGAPGGLLTPSFQSYTLTNAGNASLNWAAGANVPWLSLSQNGGALSPGGTTTVVASFNAAATNLILGTYPATILWSNLTDGITQTRSATLTLLPPPLISSQPSAGFTIEGATVTFTAAAAGGLPLFCQWQLDGTNLSDNGSIFGAKTNLSPGADLYGSLASTLTISNVFMLDAGFYTMVASNAAGEVVSSNAELLIFPSGPVIVQQPVSQTVLVGATVQFTVALEGTTPFGFQWQQNGANLTDGTGVSGSATATLTLTDVSSASIGTYTVLITNAASSTLSAGAVLSVQAPGPGGNMSADGPPIIVTQPASQTGVLGGSVTFTVLSAGQLPLFYQWQFDGVAIQDATNATLTLSNLSTNQAGSYEVQVVNSLGFDVSSNALLTVLNGNQELITFDDLPYRILPVPAGYGNLNWSNFFYLNGGVAKVSGFNAGVVSAPKVAYNSTGTPATLSAPTSFALLSAYLTAAFNDNLQLEAQGYAGSTLAYDNTYTLSATNPTLIGFNYMGVTSVQFIASGGTPHRGYAGSGTEFVMDNVSVFAQPIPPPPAPPLTVMYNFDGFDGGYPAAGLLQASNGSFYGTTYYGGANGEGSIFCLSTNGNLSTLFSFGNSNAYPLSGLTQGSDGNLYGTTQYGGTNESGTIFCLTTNGALATLASFNENTTGGNPSAALIQAADGNFYGTAYSGGPYGLGTVFEMTTNGTLSLLVAFDGTNGANPAAPLTQGTDGNLYGTTFSGGADGAGTAFSVTTNGAFSTLATFGGASSYPAGGLTQGTDGNFYGTSENGGTNNTGSIFCLSTNGVLSTLASFDYYFMGGYPTSTLIQAADGSFYGTAPEGGAFGTFFFGGTFGAGTIFRFTTNGGITPVFTFQCTNGLLPQASLVQGRDGNFYGTASYGGAGFDGYYGGGDGVVFRLGPIPAAAPPAVVTQPVNLNAPVGGTFTFNVCANGTPPLGYSWLRNGLPIAGATLPFYTATNAQPSDSGAQFNCLISSSYGSTLSSNALLTVSNAGPLYSFHGPDGAWSFSTLLQGAGGILYGTTEYGGDYGDGTVFSLTTNGTYTILASFQFYVTGANPCAALALGSDGNFYGTTAFGGAHDLGTIFKVAPDGSLTSIVSFTGPNGAEPYAPLVQGMDGNFYGSTYSGGTYNVGTFFRMAADGALTTLVSFDGVNGEEPYGTLLLTADGSFYGATYAGGTNNNGTVFRVTTNGALTSLVSFQNTNGAFPQSGLAQGADGLFYGATQKGGLYGDGTLFSMTTNGSLTTLFSFGGANGNSPSATLLPGSDGNLYGATTGGGLYGDGTVFCLSTNGLVTSLYNFNGANGSFPSASLIEDSAGNLYGTTTTGGIGYDGLYWSGSGVVFCLANAIAPGPPAIVTQPANALVLAGGSAIFSVGAIGSSPLTYTWQCDGTNLTGDSLSSFVTNNLQLSASGSIFTCVVSNAYGYTVSSNAILTVVPVPPPPPPGTTNPPAPIAPSQALLYSFGGFDGGHPSAALTQGADGNLYGTTGYGGAYDYGTVFRMTTNGVLSLVTSFDNIHGAYPYGGLIQGADGNFYGATTEGGAENVGAVFRVGTNGAITTLLSFNNTNGAYPYSALVQGGDGNLYGTTSTGGAFGYGTVFSLTTTGTAAFVLSFDGQTNGAYPYGPLAPAGDGSLYGATQYGGTNDNGTIFDLTTNGTLTTISSFNYAVTGASPAAGVVPGPNGDFYGTTEYGGTHDNGVIFSMTPGGVLTALFSFSGDNGSVPFGGLILASDGNFYGTTEYGGVNNTGILFSFNTNGVLSNLFSFGGSNGFYPQAGLIQGSDGYLYGTAMFGGEGFNGANLSGDGTVFRFSPDPAHTAPAVSAQPAPQLAPVSGTAAFSVTATGAPPLSYSWQRNGSPIAGANQAVYTLPNIQLTDSGSQFACVIANAFGAITTANASLTVFNTSGPLYSFHGPDGGAPSAALLQASDGSFYGTTAYGGAYGQGTLFRLSTNGLLQTLVSFNVTNGAQPQCGLTLGADGNYYGVTQGGGIYQYGTVFRLTTNGVLTTLASFDNTNGASPLASLLQGIDGNFYGAASAGGAEGHGSIFCLSSNGSLTSIFSFADTNGANPMSALLQSTNGSFYGTTEDGGTNGYGTVFTLTTNGILTVLCSFAGTNGANPQAALTPGPGGCYYGVTAKGGALGDGTVFCLATNGEVATLFSFAETNGAFPSASLLQGADGNFYGTTAQGGSFGDGAIFSLSTNGAVTTVLSFAGANGSFPNASLIQGFDGNFYGVTTGGGAGYDGLYWSGDGAVFRLANAAGPAAPVIVNQPSSMTVPIGGSATFSVTAASSTPLRYAWQRNGATISNANLSTFTIGNAQSSDSGSVFACVLSNAYGYTASANALLTVGPPSLAQNGGFELGTFADWTTNGNFANASVTSNVAFVHTGIYGAELGATNSPGYLSQTVPTIPGDLYQISCWLFCDGQTPNEFSISWNGATLFDQTNLPAASWTNILLQTSASATNTALCFAFEDDPGYFGLDDVGVFDLGIPQLQLQSVTLANGMISFSCNALPGQTFQIQVATSLNPANWISLGPPITATNSTQTVSEPANLGTQQFYRCVLQP